MQKVPLEVNAFRPITPSAAGSFRKSFSYTLQPTVWPPPLSDSHLESNLAVANIYVSDVVPRYQYYTTVLFSLTGTPV